MELKLFFITIFLGSNRSNSDTRVRRQLNFPLEVNKTNPDGCPARLPCYLSTVGVCVQALDGGKCPQGEYGNDPPVFDEVETPKVPGHITLKSHIKVKSYLQELQGGERTFGQTVFQWTGTPACPSCDRPSCECLESFSSLHVLYPDTYMTIQPPDQFPLCDQSGQAWCYVHRHSQCCGDNKQSTKFPQVDVSYQACKQPQKLGKGWWER